MFDIQKAGKQISIFRKNIGITQEELAHRLSVSPQAVSKWENGRAMPEVSLLVELAGILGVRVDEILLPSGKVFSESASERANLEHVLLPYDTIADFTGKKWPRSMAFPALLAAVKLLMGLEKRRDMQGKQMNDDMDYIIQSANMSICFGYSWGKSMCERNCLGIYGLRAEVYESRECAKERLQQLAAENIMNGYPVIVEPEEYEDIILAAGYSRNGKVLKGLSFLDGDDDKNSSVSFDNLQNFAGWYEKSLKLILIRPSEETISVAAACREALREGYLLLCNTNHVSDQPLVGYGLVIYDNWCKELREETRRGLESVECLYPHVFIHYENKMRLKQFLEYCIRNVDGIDQNAMAKAVSKYDEMLGIFEKAMHDWLNEPPQDAEAAGNIRRGFEWVLMRCKELESKALNDWGAAIEGL